MMGGTNTGSMGMMPTQNAQGGWTIGPPQPMNFPKLSLPVPPVPASASPVPGVPKIGHTDPATGLPYFGGVHVDPATGLPGYFNGGIGLGGADSGIGGAGAAGLGTAGAGVAGGAAGMGGWGGIW